MTDYSSPDLADDGAPITLARPRRESAPITRHLHDATNNPCAVAFQSTALLDGADGTALTIPELMRRWGVGRPKARDARQTLIRLGYWADVRPRTPTGEMRHVVRVWETPATLDDLQELALEYHSGTWIECGGGAYVIAADGKLIPAGQTECQKTATRGTSTDRQKTDTRSDQAKRTECQKTAGRSPSGSRLPVGSVSAGRTECQKTATQIDRERETSRRSLSIDRTRVTPDPCGGSADALPEDATTAALRELVDGLPWGQYANRTGQPVSLSRRGVTEAVAAMRAALDAGAVTLDQVEQIARAALECAKSNPLRYLIGAFSRSALPEWVERVDVVRVVHPDPAPADTSAPSPTPAPSPAPRMLPACGTCGAEEGDPLGTRSITIEGPNGALSAKPCTECRPKTA